MNTINAAKGYSTEMKNLNIIFAKRDRLDKIILETTSFSSGLLLTELDKIII